jgi:hypothetical protein
MLQFPDAAIRLLLSRHIRAERGRKGCCWTDTPKSITGCGRTDKSEGSTGWCTKYGHFQGKHRTSSFVKFCVWKGENQHFLYFFLICFSFSFFSSVCCEIPKLSVSIQKRNNRNKRFVPESDETSFCSSFGCFDRNLFGRTPKLHATLATPESSCAVFV